MELLKRNGKEKRTERVMQFGEGNFLRGFVDWMFDRLNKEHGGDFGVVAVQPLPGGMVSMLNGQDGCYSLYLRGLQNGEKTEETRIVDCITRGINPYTDTEVFFECAKNPDRGMMSCSADLFVRAYLRRSSRLLICQRQSWKALRRQSLNGSKTRS